MNAILDQPEFQVKAKLRKRMMTDRGRFPKSKSIVSKPVEISTLRSLPSYQFKGA
jgi:hypothetical protein